MSIRELTDFQRDLLSVSARDGDPHGLAVNAAIEAYYETEIPHGRLYPNLDALVARRAWTADRVTGEAARGLR